MNNLYQQYSQSFGKSSAQNNNLTLKQLISLYKNNPTQFAQANPQFQQVMQFVNQNGGNPKEVFYQLAKQKGVDPSTVLNQLL